MSDEFEFHVPMEGAPKGPFAIVGQIKARALEIVEATLGKYKTDGLKLPPKDEFLAKASALYDRTCKMVDIPKIPELIEQKLEQVMKPSFMQAAEFAYDRFAPKRATA